MLTLEDCRKIDPRLKEMSDKKLQEVIDDLYELGEIAVDSWIEKQKKRG